MPYHMDGSGRDGYLSTSFDISNMPATSKVFNPHNGPAYSAVLKSSLSRTSPIPKFQASGSGRDMCQRVFNEKDVLNPKPGELACFLRTYPGPEGTDIFTASRKRPGAISPQKRLMVEHQKHIGERLAEPKSRRDKHITLGAPEPNRSYRKHWDELEKSTVSTPLVGSYDSSIPLTSFMRNSGQSRSRNSLKYK